MYITWLSMIEYDVWWMLGWIKLNMSDVGANLPRWILLFMVDRTQTSVGTAPREKGPCYNCALKLISHVLQLLSERMHCYWKVPDIDRLPHQGKKLAEPAKPLDIAGYLRQWPYDNQSRQREFPVLHYIGSTFGPNTLPVDSAPVEKTCCSRIPE